MRSTSLISFNKFRFTNLEEILKVLEKALNQLGVDFYLIGALARDIQLKGVHGIEPPRATTDVDLAVLVKDIETYRRLMQALTNRFNFTEASEPYRLEYKDGTWIDLLPFGKIESEDRKIKIGKKRIVELSLIGLRENLEFTKEIQFEDGFKIKVATLAGICLLKFFAWNGRPVQRERDISDISFILDKYIDIYEDEIFEKHNDLLDSGWSDTLGARILGRHIKTILTKEQKTWEKFITILESNLSEESLLPIIFSRFNNRSITENIEMLKQIRTGICE
ncbi:MAG: nucleotidyl transferase AbiEii/AbiGii toxin family protein [Calditrichia bacterium]|jgi:predicted nucleotidyltransferase|nr:nucleotidyl transferase AbiEii/AbiGii toxin family protein [Calditrichia bacterium]